MADINSPVGVYPIKVARGSVKNDSIICVPGTLTITKAPLTISAGDYWIVQGEDMPDWNPYFSGFRLRETEEVLIKQPVVSCEATSGSEPGDYPVTVGGAEAQNYEITYKPGILHVSEAEHTTVIVKNASRKYGELNPDFEYEVQGANLEGGRPDISCEAD